MRARCVAVRYGDPFVENEAFAAPETLLGRDALQVVQNASVEVIDFVETHLNQMGGRLLAANAAGAEHRDLAVAPRIEVRFHVLGKVAECGSFRVERALE